MKTRNIFALIGISLAMVVGTVATLGLSKGEAKQASAAVDYTVKTAGKKFYLNLNSFTGWENDGVNFALYFFNSNSDNMWSSVNTRSQVTNHVYEFTIPGNSGKTWNNVIATRISGTTAQWSSVSNQTNDIAISGNCVTVTNWTAGKSDIMYGLKSGETLYLNTNAVTWWTDSHVYFFDALDGSAAQWSSTVAHSVSEAGTDHVLEVTVPGNGKVFYGVIAVRCKTAQSFNEAYNQTKDHFSGNVTENKVQNAVVIKSDTQDGKNWTDWENSYNISGEQRALWYGTHFINETNTACSGKIAPTSSVWTDLSEEYGHMGSEAKAVLTGADASKYGSASYTTYEEAMRRYDLIVSQRGVTGFISRGSLNSNVLTALKKNNGDGVTTVIVVVSFLALTSVGAYFFLKKRKEVA